MFPVDSRLPDLEDTVLGQSGLLHCPQSMEPRSITQPREPFKERCRIFRSSQCPVVMINSEVFLLIWTTKLAQGSDNNFTTVGFGSQSYKNAFCRAPKSAISRRLNWPPSLRKRRMFPGLSSPCRPILLVYVVCGG